jgi:peptide/nickel transport system ATP-binding protein
MTAAIEAQGVTRIFGGGRTILGREREAVHAVMEVDLAVEKGETLGIVGESGCGKSTLARMLLGLDTPTDGTIRLEGDDMAELRRDKPRSIPRRVQYVFQDPVSSLNPRKTIRHAVEAPMRRLLGLDRDKRRRRAAELVDAVGMREDHLERYPHEFSGGQIQRIAIARALAAEAEILILDEPVSSLDVSIQAQVLNILADLKQEFGLTYLFISHDLSVVESVSDRVAVMYFGRVVETGNAREMFRNPRHPYTALLMRSAPVPGQRHIDPESDLAQLPDPTNPPVGCSFASRCPRVIDRCRAERPPLENGGGGRTEAACWRPLGEDDAE